jgi:hypothetical protein
LVLAFVVFNSQIACGAYFSNATVMMYGQVMSSLPATNARMAVDRFGTIVYSMPSR